MSTQNDWEKQLSSLIDDTIENRHDYKGSLVVEDDILFERLNENLKPFVAELLADARKEGHELGRSESVEFEVDKARKEVIDRIEKVLCNHNYSSMKSKEIFNVKEEIRDVLAILREEEQHG